MIERLVATPSVSAVDPAFDMGNGAVIDALANWLEDEGWAVSFVSVTDEPLKKNLIATRGRGPGGLVLSGHTDTVPFDEGQWQSDPFVATERDDRIHGLGTADMKSFLALAIVAARAFDDRDLKEPLILLATADEESGMAGAKALVRADRPKARRAIIGEPTGLQPIRMHKGCAMERLSLVGRTGHSSDPSFGLNALDGMHAAIGAIIEVRDALAHAHNEPLLTPPGPTMNLGRISGGDNPNRICGACELDFDIRLLPGMRIEEVRKTIADRVEKTLEGRGLALEIEPLMEALAPFETAADSAFVREVEALTGYAAGAASFGTEAPLLAALGMETIVCGPGSIDVAHQPNEYLSLAELDPTIELVQRLIANTCTKDTST